MDVISYNEARKKMFCFDMFYLRCPEIDGSLQFEDLIAVTLASPNQAFQCQVTGYFDEADEWAKRNPTTPTPFYVYDGLFYVPAVVGTYYNPFGTGATLGVFSCDAMVVQDGAMLELKMFFERTSLNGGTIYTKATMTSLS